MVGAKRLKELAAGLRGVFAAPTRGTALGLAFELADRWRESHPKVAEHVEEHIEQCLTCLGFPEGHRRRIRTTNGPERLNQQIKRRTRVVRIFQPGVVPEAGNGVGRRAIGGVADGEALPGDGGAARAPWFRGAGGRGGETHGAMSVLILGGNYRAFGT